MKTKEVILEAVKAGKKSECLDGRDFQRLIDFFPASDWPHFKFHIRVDAEPPSPQNLTEAAVIEHMKSDVAFGFEKALDQRGLSAASMYSVVQMWLWVLDDSLQYHDQYAQYGLPLFKAVAIKYGFPNPIGDNTGSELKYQSD